MDDILDEPTQASFKYRNGYLHILNEEIFLGSDKNLSKSRQQKVTLPAVLRLLLSLGIATWYIFNSINHLETGNTKRLIINGFFVSIFIVFGILVFIRSRPKSIAKDKILSITLRSIGFVTRKRALVVKYRSKSGRPRMQLIQLLKGKNDTESTSTIRSTFENLGYEIIDEIKKA